MNGSTSALRIRLRSESGEPADLDLSFSGVFRIGRDPSCEVQLSSPLVSRFHAEVWPGSGSWWVRDLGSTNRLILNGKQLDRGEIRNGDTLQLGKGAPVLIVSLLADSRTDGPPGPDSKRRFLRGKAGRGGDREAGSTVRMMEPRGGQASRSTPTPQQPGEGPGLSLSEIEEKYLNPDSDRPAGERTQFIRMAYARVRKREHRKARLVLGTVGFMLLASATYGLYQQRKINRIDRQAAEFFRQMKSYEVQLVALRQQAEDSGSPELIQQLASIESAREAQLGSYDAYVRERGLYRRLKTREDTLIYETARVFGESEFEISGGFINAIQSEITGYWLSPSGRNRFLRAIERAERNGHTGTIVATLARRGVPPEFFYLALQESEFQVTAVGPETRWGRAKGMWQFIPATAQRYGLTTGSMIGTGERDPNDERLNFEMATDAAARYLRDLHGILTQASGLLVMAAYNWGEHRVAPRLEALEEPRDVFREEFAGVPANPTSRNYWTFLTEYEDRMPEETKQYVIRIFAAAVIGRDPKHFGLELDNPLTPYVE